MAYLYIAIGSALGGVARYWCSAAVAARLNSSFPWGTLTVNVVGSFAIGAAMGALEPASGWRPSPAAREFVNQFFMIGLLGGFTTFSSFSAQTLALLRSGDWTQAGANVLLSAALCLIAVAVGFWLTAR